MSNSLNKLIFMLGNGGLNGTIPVAALAGIFKPENAFSIATLFMAGPGAILTAIFMDGTVRERMFAALLAGLISTLIVVLSAGIGPELLRFVNLNVLKVFGGIAILAIGLLIMGINIPSNTPTIIMILGLLLSILWR